MPQAGPNRSEQARILAREQPGLTIAEIAARVGLQASTVHCALKKTGRGPRRVRTGPRAVTISQTRGRGHETPAKVKARAHLVVIEEDRPRVRFECERAAGGDRPCPWVGCRHHLATDVHTQTGGLKLNFPGDGDEDPAGLEGMAQTCSLDVAARGGLNLEQVGHHMNITRERARQLEERALHKIKVRGGARLLALLAESMDVEADRDRRNT